MFRSLKLRRKRSVFVAVYADGSRIPVDFAGGDTAVVFNYEYRIPIVGPVTLAPFLDAGIDRLTLPSQLGLNPDRVRELNGIFPAGGLRTGAPILRRTLRFRAYPPVWSCRC